ncbi:MAG: hypothetical protein AAGE52_36065 [Myxococcota bacterium]
MATSWMATSWMATSAHAQSYDLNWIAGEGTESCPREAMVAADVAARLQRNPFSSESPQQLFVELTRSATHWHAALAVRHANGEEGWSRPLQSASPSCDTLGDAVVLAIVLMIDPAMAVAPVPEADTPVETDAEADPETEAEAAAEAATETSPPVEPPDAGFDPRISAHAGASFAGGVLPEFAASAHLGVEGAIAGPLRWGFGMRFFPEVQTASGDFAFGLTSFSLTLCAEGRPIERLLLGGCVSPMIGVIHAVVFEPDPTFPGDRAWAGLATDLSAQLRVVGPLWVRVEGGVLWSLLRRRFDVRNEPEPAFRQDLAGLNLAVSLALRFP